MISRTKFGGLSVECGREGLQSVLLHQMAPMWGDRIMREGCRDSGMGRSKKSLKRERCILPCLNCGKPKTIEAHLIPKAFVMEVKVDRGEQHLIVHKGNPHPKVSHTGVYDKDILCGDCEEVVAEIRMAGLG